MTRDELDKAWHALGRLEGYILSSSMDPDVLARMTAPITAALKLLEEHVELAHDKAA